MLSQLLCLHQATPEPSARTHRQHCFLSEVRPHDTARSALSTFVGYTDSQAGFASKLQTTSGTHHETNTTRTGEVAQGLKTPASLPEDHVWFQYPRGGSQPNSSFRESNALFLASTSTKQCIDRHTHKQSTCMHKVKRINHQVDKERPASANSHFPPPPSRPGPLNHSGSPHRLLVSAVQGLCPFSWYLAENN